MSKVDKAYLKQLVETPSVTGTETRIASVVRERLSEVADEIETNVMGSVHARLVGSGSAPSVMIAAHMDEVGMIVEGVYSAKAAIRLAQKYQVELPIIEQVNKILFEDKKAADALNDLMLRDPKTESDAGAWK